MNKAFWGENVKIRLFRSQFFITRKNLLLFLAVLIIPITICLIIYSQYSATTIENEIYRNMKVTVAQAKNNVDYRTEQVENNAMSILHTIYPYLNTTRTTEEQLSDFYDMTRLFADYQGHNMISNLRLYVPNSFMYSRQGDTFYSLDDLPDFSEQYSDYNFKSGPIWLESNDITITFGEKPIPVVSCVTAISSTSNYDNIIGILYLNIAVSQFNSMLSSGIGKNECLFITNSEGVVQAQSTNFQLSSTPFSAVPDFHFSGNSGAKTIVLNGQEVLTVYSKLDAADWYLVMTVPRSAVFSYSFFSLDLVRLSIIVIILLSFIATVILTYYIVVDKYIKRINSTINTLETEGISSIAEQLKASGADSSEIKPNSLASLEQNANRMALIINTLLKRQYKNEIAVRDYQMRALQAQINPHFLYNTLDIIKWMIIDDDKDGSVFMVNALSRYFQQSLSKGKDLVRIEDEIELTKTYLSIMQKRFQNKFDVDFSIAPQVQNCLIPKLSLQPLVENALLHGILYTEKPDPRMSIRITQEEDSVCIDIEDNGDGMDQETLSALHETRLPGKSYGLANVRERLELFGADPSWFEIYSKEGVGTCISLRIPVKFSS